MDPKILKDRKTTSVLFSTKAERQVSFVQLLPGITAYTELQRNVNQTKVQGEWGELCQECPVLLDWTLKDMWWLRVFWGLARLGFSVLHTDPCSHTRGKRSAPEESFLFEELLIPVPELWENPEWNPSQDTSIHNSKTFIIFPPGCVMSFFRLQA